MQFPRVRGRRVAAETRAARCRVGVAGSRADARQVIEVRDSSWSDAVTWVLLGCEGRSSAVYTTDEKNGIAEIERTIDKHRCKTRRHARAHSLLLQRALFQTGCEHRDD